MGSSSSKSSRRNDRRLNFSDIHAAGQVGESPPSYFVATLPASSSQFDAENALLAIRNYNVVFVIDDSASMTGKGPNGVRLWTEARDALGEIAEHAQKYDTDGIDVYFFNDPRVGSGLKSSKEIESLFNGVVPTGMTPMAGRLEKLLLEYLSKLESDPKTKPVNYIVLTDGAPTDEPESVIVAAAERLDKGNFPITQVGIQFVQIGNHPHATKFLNELDDDLKQLYKIRDIVDTTPYVGGQLTVESLMKILLGGINRRVDRRGGGSVL